MLYDKLGKKLWHENVGKRYDENHIEKSKSDREIRLEESLSSKKKATLVTLKKVLNNLNRIVRSRCAYVFSTYVLGDRGCAGTR